MVEAIEAETEIARHGPGKSWSQKETWEKKLGEKCQHIFDVKIVIARNERETPAVATRWFSSSFPVRSVPKIA